MNILTVEKITKAYGERKLFAQASFYMQEGEKVGVIGINGTGKSTLLHLLAGLDRPNNGSIYIRSRDITRMSADELAAFRGESIGMIYQKHNLTEKISATDNFGNPTGEIIYNYQRTVFIRCYNKVMF